MSSKGSNHREPVLVRAADAEVLSAETSSPITLLADSDATSGALTSNRSLLRKGSDGAPPHYHTRSNETFFVLAGSLDVLVNDRVHTLTEGDFLFVPAQVPHAFAPSDGFDADVLVVFAPGLQRFDYYRLLDRVYKGEADPQELSDTQSLYDNHYVDSRVWTESRAGR